MAGTAEGAVERSDLAAATPGDPTAAVLDDKRLAALRRTGLLDAAPDEAFDRLTRLAARLLDAPVALVSLVDDDRQFFLSEVGLPEPWAARRETPLSRSVCQYAVAGGRPLVIPDLRGDPGFCDHPAIADLSVVAYLGIPMVLESGQVIGSFCVIDAVPRQWSDADVAAMTDLAGCVMAEIALREYALRVDEMARVEHRARLRSDFLADLGRQLPAITTVEERARLVVGLLVPAVADVAAIELPGEDEPLLAVAGPEGTTAAAWSARRPRPGAGPSGGGPAVLEVPFEIGRRRGVLVLARSGHDPRPFDDEEVAFAGEVARQAGVSLSAARLLEEERGISLRLQRALLPGTVAAPAGIEVAACYHPSTTSLEVGGDWYDTIALPDGRLGLTVGDVVGHGLEAAAAMGRLRTALQALAPHGPHPGAVLDRLARFAAGPDGCRFATAAYAVVDPVRRRVELASAGHPPVLLLDPEGGERWLRVPGSPPLIASVPGGRASASAELPPGSLLVLYSDGLVERRGEALDVGLDRLLDAVRRHRRAPLDELCEGVLAEVGAAHQPEDDAVVLAVRL